MVPIGLWQYNFTSERGQPLHSSKIRPKIFGPQSVRYLEVSLYHLYSIDLTHIQIGLIAKSLEETISVWLGNRASTNI